VHSQAKAILMVADANKNSKIKPNFTVYPRIVEIGTDDWK
jgi:hypothetical protein